MPVDFPPTLMIEQLEVRHPVYDQLKDVWHNIDLLCAGGHRLKAEVKKFLPLRPGENPDIYRERIAKFSYLNVMGDSIRKQVSRLSQGSINLSNIPAAEEEFFERFRENTNGKGRTEKNLIGLMLGESLKFKYLFLHADQPPAPFEGRSLAERDQLAALGVVPYINLYRPMEVINWEGEDESSQLYWIKTRKISSVSMGLFDLRLSKVTWTFITFGGTAVYSCLCELNEDGSIKTLVGEDGKPKPTTVKTPIPLESSPTLYELPYAPVVLLELPDELWLADDATSKAYEHLRLSCHHFDLLTSAYFQRTYKPIQVGVPDFNDPTSEEDPGKPDVGMQYVAKLDAFTWNEPTGAIVPHIQAALDRIEQQIRASIALATASIAPQNSGVLEQSGKSKEMDYVLSGELVEQYGALICDALQDIYQLVLWYRGYPIDSVETIELSVSGLDHFEVDSLSDLIASLLEFLSVDLVMLQKRTPPTLFSLIMKRLVNLLVSNTSPQEQSDIEQELETLTLEEPEPPEVRVVKNDQGLEVAA